MKHTRTWMATLLLGTLLALPAVTPAQVKAEVALRAAMETETVKGDLKSAIEQYKKIAQGGDRATAAKALVRMAECFQKLGNDGESRGIYERVAREFADQAASAATARTRLAALHSTDVPAVAGAAGLSPRRVWESRTELSAAISPDGRHLVVTDVGPTYNLLARDFRTEKNRLLTNNSSGGWSDWPVLSPDGRRVAYAQRVRSKDEWRLQLRVAELDAFEPRILFDDHEIPRLQPYAWSPDGKTILAVFSRRDRTNQIVLVSAADGSVQTLKSLEWRYPGHMSLSADGRFIAYDVRISRDSPTRNIFVLFADGTRETAVVEHAADDSFPVWTPDGTKILFISDRTGAPGYWVIPVSEGKPRGAATLVKAEVGPVRPVGFTKDGAYYYRSTRQKGDVYLAEFEPKTAKLLKQAQLASTGFRGSSTAPRWSPDGRNLAYISFREAFPDDQPRSLRRTPGLGVVVIGSVESGQERELSP